MKQEKQKNLLNKILKLLSTIVISFVCLLVIFLVYYIITSQIHANDESYKPPVSVYTIVSPSMTPVINVYDVVVNKRVNNPENIQVGDIITYISQSPTSEGMTITHRVVAISQLPDGTYEYMTQGDNNSEPDSLYVTFNQVIGKEIIIIPYLGKLQFLIANQKGWLFLLLIPVSIYVLIEIYKLIDLFGLRKRVNEVIGTTEESVIEKRRIEEQERKIAIKEELKNKNSLKESLNRSELEPIGFLERYSETTETVSKNKYAKKQNKKQEKVTIHDQVIPTKVSAGDNKPEKETKKVELPKVKEERPVINTRVEILDTDELTTKIKEYDSKIEKLDKMIADMEKIPVAETPKKEEFIEKNNYLSSRKIRVKSSEPTKNQKKTLTPKPKVKKEPKQIDLTPKIELTQKVEHENTRMKVERPVGEDIKVVRERELKKKETKKGLNLNPKTVKTVNRKTKKKEEPTLIPIQEEPISIPEEPKEVIIEESPKEIIVERKVENPKPIPKTEPTIIEPMEPVEEQEMKNKKSNKPFIEIRKVR